VELVEAQHLPAWVSTVMRANPLYHLCALWRASSATRRAPSSRSTRLLKFGITSFVVFVVVRLFRRWKGSSRTRSDAVPEAADDFAIRATRLCKTYRL